VEPDFPFEPEYLLAVAILVNAGVMGAAERANARAGWMDLKRLEAQQLPLGAVESDGLGADLRMKRAVHRQYLAVDIGFERKAMEEG